MTHASPLSRVSSAVRQYLLPADELDPQQAIFRALCRVGAVLTIWVSVPVNLLQGLPVTISVAAMGFGLLCLWLNRAARQGRFYPSVLVATAVITINAAWFPNAGSHGSILLIAFPVMLLPIVFYHGRTRWVSTSLVVANFLALLALEAWFPALLTPFRSDTERMIDLLIGTVVSGTTLVLVVGVVLSWYQRERQRLRDSVEAAAESRALIESLVNSASEMVWLADPRTHEVLLFNQAFRDYFRDDHQLEVYPGLGPDAFLPPDVAATWHGLYNRALAQGPFTLEYTTASRHRILWLSFNVVRHEDRILGVSVFGKDVTAERRDEQRQAKMELELLQTQKMESLGMLAGGVAHDFNNMLDGIMGYADLMLDEESDPLRRSRLDAILRAATRSSELTRKLLAFARRGKNIVEAVDVNVLVADGLCMLRPSIQQDVRVVTELDQTWTIDGDPSQISQVVMNLCINAGEAMSRGGALHVSTANRTFDRAWADTHGRPAGDYVELRVSDSGVGMSADVKSRIFEPFYTTKVDGLLSGTGLGLATVYGVVQLHHGVIDVTSTPGAGTTFTVWLPRGVLVSGPARPASARTAGQGLVLIVEDEDLLRELHSEMLEKIGYRSVTAADGAEAVELFRRHHADLTAVLLDLKMPSMGGREAFLAMRAINDRVPVLICSGFGDNEEAQGLITLGARGLLAKPFRLADLAERIEAMQLHP